MAISLFLGQFFGWLLVIVCLIFLLRRKVLSEELFWMIENKAFLLFSGYLSLVIGLCAIILHNIWVADWRVVVTIFGWLSLVKGVVRIGFPEVPEKLVSVFKNRPQLMQGFLIIAIFLGAWLIWVSY